MSAEQVNNRRAFLKDGSASKRTSTRNQGSSSAATHRNPQQQQRPARNAPSTGPPPLIPGNQVESALRKDTNSSSHTPPAPANSGDHISVALQHARTTTPGYYIGQDSKFGNLILPVLPEFTKDW